MVADTTLFVDLIRGDQAAADVLDQIAQGVSTTWITVGELREGWLRAKSARKGDEIIKTLLEGMTIHGIDSAVADHYAAVQAELSSRGQRIGTNDAWIAAIALRHGMPVITRNNSEFERVPGLRVVGY